MMVRTAPPALPRIAPPALPRMAPPALPWTVGSPVRVFGLSTSLAAPVTLRFSGEPGFFTRNERPRMVWSAAFAHPASIIDNTAATADTLAIRFIGPLLTSGIRRLYPALRRPTRAYRRARTMSRRCHLPAA